MVSRRVALVVQDVPDQLERLTVALHVAGYNVLTAIGSEQAFAKAVLHRPDVGIIDLQLSPQPWALCRRLHDDERTLRLRLVLLTAVVSTRRGEMAPAGDFIVLRKPADPVTIVRAVQQAMQASNPASEHPPV